MKKTIAGIAILFFMLSFTAIENQAATLTVTNLNDNGGGSLRQTIINASNGDTIIFAANLSGSIVLNSEISINKSLFVNGSGANILRVEGINNGLDVRVFRVTSGTTIISNLRIANGFSSGAGGGILVNGGNLTLNNCILNGNIAESGGGVIVFTGSTLTITNSTITGNESFVEGGGVSNRGGTLILTNSTITGNIAPQGGGVSVESGGTATILNCTVTNYGVPSPQIGDIGGLRIAVGSTVNLKNTIVGNNIGSPTTLTDVGGIVNSLGNNLIGDTFGATGFMASDLLNVNPRLSSLAHNGGATYTHSLLSNSPAINAGNNANSPATDQRGVARPQGGISDIGAFESGVNSPPFGKIVFVIGQNNNSEIYSMNADFTNQNQLTNNLTNDSSPKWSPDGTKILFQSNRDGSFPEIYTMNADGSNPVRLTNNSIVDQYPGWSPDGSKIVFVRGNSLPSEIWTMDSNGLNQVQITGSSINSLLGETEPSWSPDGSRIAFSANPNSGEGPEIYVMNANGTNQNRLTFDAASDTFPVWSPDGNSIAYTNDSSGGHTNIFNLAGLSIHTVSNPNNPFAYAPAWSPDGTKLAHYNSIGNIYIIDAGGENTFANFAPEGIVISPQLDWFGFNTETGTNVTAISGTTSITFSGVSNSGTTTVVPIDPTTAGNVPSGYSLGAGFPAFEITTTATFTAPITVCVQVPSVTDVVTFNRLTLLHGEGGILVDRTSSRNFATKTICANVSSLSPFVVARSLAPTAANVSISGRVSASNGRGISRVRMSITDQNGEIRFAVTNSFGFYRFTELSAGETYIIAALHKRYQFNSQVITVSEDLQGIDFTAEP